MLKELAIYICILVVICQGRTLPTEITTTATIAEGAETTEASTEESSTLASLAVSRDEEASILIDPAQGSTALQQLDDKSQQKSAKLLLLSAPPKRHPVEMEQQFEEQDEVQDNPTAAASATNDEAATTPTTTQASLEVEMDTTTNATHEDNMDATTTATTATTTEAITKLFAINATVASMDAPPPSVAVALAMDNSTVSIVEQPQEAGNNNAAIELALVEPEAEYVLVSDDDDNDNDEHHHELGEFGELQLGSFTHIDSDVHLQPVVHSVEIVPTSFDDPLIVNYVHNLR
ncbi:uncharacterized protein Dwil_GK17121 [Drosophila willistoni]|uniref:DUF4794 domain-containing protein n=1 Tax=Drosophila willistoni TaxID=7260 RepID=B4MNF0_DROWI|nr:uncharacterized protein YBL113C [Drosophila willistoni]EDW72659.1 uncharacterized protein Dwil_GK17121 [Drosophila willistoni]